MPSRGRARALSCTTRERKSPPTHFALTDMVLGSKDLPIISRVKGHDHREGTLDDWREVAALADGNPAMIFAVSRAGGKAFKGEVPLPEPLFPRPA